MSDFASLLKNFETTSKRAAEVPPKPPPSKRQRSSSDDSKDRPPHDIHQLSVKVDFLCIGAQKAGTTWLYEMLRKIPQVGLPDMKEVHFWDWNRRKGLGWYSRQFPTKGNLTLGEITPCYMALKGHDIKEVHQVFPEARIIFLARDLVDRAWSALTMELRNEARGLKAGEFDIPYDQMDARMRNKLQRDSDPKYYDDDYFMSRLRRQTHSDRSDYARGLSRWLTHFPSDQILVLNFEDVALRPKELLQQILEHIGVTDTERESAFRGLSEDDLQRRVNTAIVPNQAIRSPLRRKMEGYLRPHAVEFNKLLKTNWPDLEWKLKDYSN
jgi:hypothetical protein